MARHKKDTPEGKLESERWREAMKRIYGGDKGVSEYFRELGMRGGKTPCKSPKGFAANPAKARLAGAKGGKISRRWKIQEEKWQEVREDVIKLYNLGVPATKIAEKYGLSPDSVRSRLRSEGKNEV